MLRRLKLKKVFKENFLKKDTTIKSYVCPLQNYSSYTGAAVTLMKRHLMNSCIKKKLMLESVLIAIKAGANEMNMREQEDAKNGWSEAWLARRAQRLQPALW